MRTRLLLFIVSLISCIGFSQTSTTISLPNVQNEIEVSLKKKNKEVIEVFLTDSKNSSTSKRVEIKEDALLTQFYDAIFDGLKESVKEYKIEIPDTKVFITMEGSKLNKDNLINGFLKLKKDDYLKILKAKFKIKNDTSNITYNDFIKEVKKDTLKTILTLNSTAYKFKYENDQYHFYMDTVKNVKVSTASQDDFLNTFYMEYLKGNDSINKQFITNYVYDDSFDELLVINFKTDENVKKIEDLYNSYKLNDLKISSYEYLAYVGTNFDLVDGVKTKNLFFATNILKRPKKNKNKVGFYLSLYGNRTLSLNDSIKYNERNIRVFDSIVDGNTIRFIQKERYDFVRTVNIDNLGAYFSPLLRINKWNLSGIGGETQVYYSPSLEFIWRRITVTSGNVNIEPLDPYVIPSNIEPYTQTYTDEKSGTNYNIFDFYVGILGFFMAHENESISIRLNMNTGLSFSYLPESLLLTREEAVDYRRNLTKISDYFYTGKLWITEATTGITLQAEIKNSYKNPNPYYGVTLSKAFDFENIGKIFSPVYSRNK